MRNQKARFFIVCFFMSALLSATYPALSGEVYWSDWSVDPGKNITLYASATKSPLKLSIYESWRTKTMPKAVIEGIAVQEQSSEPLAFRGGARWNPTYQLHIPVDWPTGIYTAMFGSETSHFIVKPLSPGMNSKILVIDNAMTDIAYNNWGGKSLYNMNSGAGKSASLALDRPNQQYMDRQIISFARWAHREGIAVEYASMMDLERDPYLLSHYRLLVIVGKSEYWTLNQRDQYDEFVRQGGNVLVLGGCTMLWRVKIDNGNLVCEKNRSLRQDADFFNPEPLDTGKWANEPFNRPENFSIGAAWRHGGWINHRRHYLAGPGSHNGGYKVMQPKHWIFEGTNLKRGDYFGVRSTIAGKEVDGVPFDMVSGFPVVKKTSGVPYNYSILAIAKAFNKQAPRKVGWGTLGIFEPFEGGGKVFNASTIDWADGLWYLSPEKAKEEGSRDWSVHTMTKNLIRVLGR